MQIVQRISILVIAALVAGSGLMGGIVSRFLVSAPAAEAQNPAVMASVVTAQELRLVDAQGRVRLEAGVAADGEVYLSLNDADGVEVLYLSAFPDGEPYLALNDGLEDRATLQLADGAPFLSLYDVGGVRRIYLGEATDGNPIMRIRDAQGTSRIYIGQLGSGAPSIEIANAQGGTIWSAP
jgi:hypothetical protein